MSHSEQKKVIKELFISNVSDENAVDFVSEIHSLYVDGSTVTSDDLADAVIKLLFDPLEEAQK